MSKGQDGKSERVGDDTLARIDDLKGGWKLPQDAPTTSRPPTAPPPVPKTARDETTRPLPPPPTPSQPLPPQPKDRAVQEEKAPKPKSNITAQLQVPDTLPRRAGALGDVAYFIRVMAKKRSVAVELGRIEERLLDRREVRTSKLLDYARHAVGDEAYDQTLVGRARVSLLGIEEKRSVQAGRIASADAKVAALEHQRGASKKQSDDDVAALRLEMASLSGRLQPLIKKAAVARKKTTELHKQLRQLDADLRKKKGSVGGTTDAGEKAGMHAAIASMQAEREVLAEDEPVLATEIGELEPKIAALNAATEELRTRISGLGEEEETDAIRSAEKEAAVKASRVVAERAVSDQSTKQEKELLQLGESLHAHPPDTLDPKATVIAGLDVEVERLERRKVELHGLMQSVEKGPLLRGGLYLALLVLLVGGAVAAYLLL